MNLDSFVNRDIGTFLHALRPLEGWEQLHVIYHSTRSLHAKRAAYAALLNEFTDNAVLAGHLRRNIQKVDIALDASSRKAVQGRIFTASIEKGFSKKEEGTFSTYVKARLWLDTQRQKVRESGKAAISMQRIAEIELDTGYHAAAWYFDDLGEPISFDDADLDVPPSNEPLPEARYVRLPGVFSPGDIVRLCPTMRNEYKTGFAVVPFGFDERVQLTGNPADYNDVRVLVMRYDADDEYVWRDCWALWDTERLHGDLPESQKILLAISRHCKGEERLDEEIIVQLDPDKSFHWEKGKIRSH